MTDQELTDLLARKFAEKKGYDPEQMITHAGEKARIGREDFVSVGVAFPLWQAFRGEASAMIEALKSLGPEAQAAFSRLLT